MNFKEMHDEAIAELRSAMLWYERKQSGLGSDLLHEVRKTVEQIRRSPLMFAADEDNGSRASLTARFPYVIRFFVRPDGGIWIVAIAHASRDPEYWIHRIPD